MYDWKFRKWERKVETYQEQIRRKKMKITVKSRPKQCDIPFDEIPIGYVYVSRCHDGPIMLKLKDNEAVLLTYSDDENKNKNNWFKVAEGYKNLPATKILGKLTEIIVEEE